MSYYDSIASGYDELHGQEQKEKNRLIRRALADLRTHPDKVLDVGCGTGISSEGIGTERIGIDPSEELLKQCSFPTVRGGAEQLPFPDKSFDLVICVTAIHNTSNPEKAMKEIARVTKEYAVITILKKSKQADELTRELADKFTILQAVDEAKDKIFILKVKR